jgi:mannosyltransferase
MPSNLEEFTQRARRARQFARDAAWLCGYKYIGAERQVLGLVREHEGIVALTILAFAVGSYRVGVKSLWLDEGFSASNAQLGGLSGLWTVVSGGVPGDNPNMGLYFALLHFWVRLFGYTDASLRSMSVLLGGLAVPIVAMLGWRLFGRSGGLAAGLLLAVAPFFVQYEQTARSYALLVTLVALSSYCFAVELERPSRSSRVAYVLATALAFYAHYMAAFVIVVQALTLLAVKRRAAFTQEWLTSGVCLTVLCAPEFVFAARAGTGAITWVPRPNFSTVVNLPFVLAGAGQPASRAGTVIAWLLLVLACFGFARLVAEGRRWQAGFLAAWCVGPVLLDLSVSWLGPSLFLDYYLIIVLPALVLLAAAGAVRLPGKAITGRLLAVVLALPLLVGLNNWYWSSSVENYRAATSFLLGHAQDGDAVFYEPSYVAIPFVHYQSLAQTTGPRVMGALPAREATDRPRRIWLVFRESDVPPVQRGVVERTLDDGYVRVGPEMTFNGAVKLTLVLYQAR